MAESRLLHDWDRTALDLATHANIHKNNKRHPGAISPAEFHPMRTAKDYKPEPIEADISVLKMLLRK